MTDGALLVEAAVHDHGAGVQGGRVAGHGGRAMSGHGPKKLIKKRLNKNWPQIQQQKLATKFEKTFRGELIQKLF